MSYAPPSSLHPQRLPDLLVQRIKQRIASGDLGPGALLPPERALAAQFNVSRTSVREALARLASEGYVDLGGRAGNRIADLSASRIASPLSDLLAGDPNRGMDILEVRMALESIATVYAAERANAADLARIRQAFDALQQATTRGPDGDLVQRDLDFHFAVAEATHNVALIHVMRGMHTLIQESMQAAHKFVVFDDTAELELRRQHDVLFKTIQRRDPTAARAAAEVHLQYVKTLYQP